MSKMLSTVKSHVLSIKAKSIAYLNQFEISLKILRWYLSLTMALSLISSRLQSKMSCTGGAAGGGKSFALLADPLRYCHNSNFRGLLLRRTLDELTELIDKSKQLYTKAFPGAVFRESNQRGTSPLGQLSGSPI